MLLFLLIRATSLTVLYQAKGNTIGDYRVNCKTCCFKIFVWIICIQEQAALKAYLNRLYETAALDGPKDCLHNLSKLNLHPETPNDFKELGNIYWNTCKRTKPSIGSKSSK